MDAEDSFATGRVGGAHSGVVPLPVPLVMVMIMGSRPSEEDEARGGELMVSLVVVLRIVSFN